MRFLSWTCASSNQGSILWASRGRHRGNRIIICRWSMGSSYQGCGIIVFRIMPFDLLPPDHTQRAFCRLTSRYWYDSRPLGAWTVRASRFVQVCGEGFVNDQVGVLKISEDLVERQGVTLNRSSYLFFCPRFLWRRVMSRQDGCWTVILFCWSTGVRRHRHPG